MKLTVKQLRSVIREVNETGFMGNFAVFAGASHYPRGGWEDFKASFPSRDEAVEVAKAMLTEPDDDGDVADWSHVIDLRTGTRIFKKY